MLKSPDAVAPTTPAAASGVVRPTPIDEDETVNTTANTTNKRWRDLIDIFVLFLFCQLVDDWIPIKINDDDAESFSLQCPRPPVPGKNLFCFFPS